VQRSAEGVVVTPLSVYAGKRTGTREYIRRIQAACPGHLTVMTNALTTRVLFDDDHTAIGVEYLEGAHLYRADPNASSTDQDGVTRKVRVSREVILCAGAFNSPQLLMLSGIGPKEALQQHGIEVRLDRPGVGKNLQDRYEVGVVNELKEDFAILKNATFEIPKPGEPPDPLFSEWLQGKGVYTSNGAIISIVKRSDVTRPEPDLFIFGLAGFFKGYFPGYSEAAVKGKNFFTWAILNAHTNNTAGEVTLTSNNPRDVPHIDFHYFTEGNDTSGEDLDSVVEGVAFVRRMSQRTEHLIKAEQVPGKEVDTPDKIREFIRDNAWGHHASCSNKMGPQSDPMAVVDSEFRVHGTQNLRVVDASVFPRIPGFFIVSAIYMISEKAADVILKAAGHSA
jgi:choline dehydrogenase